MGRLNSKLKITFSLALIGVLLFVGAFQYYNQEKERIKASKIDDLEVISKLKTNQLAEWYSQRLFEADYFSKNANLINQVEALSRNINNTEALKYLKTILVPVETQSKYENILVVADDNRLLFNLNPQFNAVDSVTLEYANECLLANQTIVNDFYFSQTHNKIYFDIFAQLNTKNEKRIGVIIFRIKPKDFLYPLIQSWPVESKTAETLLFKKEEDHIHFLNHLRFRKNDKLQFNIPLARTDIVGVLAALGTSGTVEAKDYRDVEVLAHTQPIVGTPWIMVSKIDYSEVYGEMNARLVLIFLVSITSFLFFGTGIFLFFNYRKTNLYKEMFLKEKDLNKTKEELLTTLYSIGDGVISTDKSGCIQRMNKVAEKLTGWVENEARGKNLKDVFVTVEDGTDRLIESPVEKILKSGKIIALKNNTLLISKDGRRTPIADSGAPIKLNDSEIDGVVLVFRDETDTRRKKKMLKESEAKFSAVFHYSPIGIILTKVDGTIIDVNKIFLDTSGFTKNEVVGSNTQALGLWRRTEDRDQFIKLISEKGSVPRFESEFCMKSGEIKTCFISAELVELDREKLILSTILDVTDLKQAEKALIEKEQFLSEMGRIAKVGGWEFDIETMKGSSTEQVAIIHDIDFPVNTSVEFGLQFYTEESRGRLEKAIKEATENGNPFDLELELISAKGKHKWIRTIGKPIKENGRVLRVKGSFQDITDRVKADETLRSSEKKFSTAFHTSPDAVNINRMADGLYIEVNEGFCKITGYTPEDVIGKSSLELSIWKSPEDRNYLVQQLKNSGEVNNFEAPFVLKNGSTIIGLMSAKTINLNGEDCILTITRDITERKHAEEVLQESQDKYQSVVSNVKEVIFQTDIEGHWTFLNLAWEEITGFKYEESLGSVCDSFVHPEDRQLGHELFNSLINKEKDFCRNEIRYLKKTGGFSWVEVYATLQLDNTGNAIGTTGTLMNITERKKAEEEIRKLSRGLEQSPAEIIITDTRGNIEYVNPSFTRVTGYTAGEVIGKNTRILKSGNKTSEEYKNLWETISDKREWRGEFQNRKKNGELFWESASISPIIDENGEVTNFIAVKEDITDQKQLAEELSNERILLRTLINNIPDAIFVKDHQSRKLVANRADLKFMGVQNEADVLGKTDFNFYSSEVAEKFHNDDQQILKNGKSIINKETSFTDKDGQTHWILTSKLPLCDSKNNITGLVGISRDVTKQKFEKLELIRAKEKAEDMNRLKSYFYANISHELRTPFVGILGYSELLADSLQNPEEKEMAEVILKSSKRLTETLNKILNIAKLEFDKPQLHLTEINIIDFIKNIHKLYIKSAELQKSTITVNFKSQPILIKTDEMFLNEILTNLVSNAVKYCQNGRIEITSEVIIKSNKELLEINVADTGIGIPEEKQEIIWQEFRQVSEGFNRSFEGTGLGLSLVKKYVELLGGSISLKSAIGKGSLFTIQLPIETRERKSELVIASDNHEIMNDSDEKTKQTEKILLVEDEAITADFIKRILSGYCIVDAAKSAEDALQKTGMYQYPLLLLDINLGHGMDGVELLQKIRDQKNYKEIPAVAITAFASTSDKEEFLSKGFNHYISKPFVAKDLRKLLKDILLLKRF
jgi:PAS domain S-box-containing protein